MPVGCIQPSFQASKMHTNNTIDAPTRSANARAMALERDEVPLLPRSIKNSAALKHAKIIKNASVARYDMRGIIL
jgi:hypothetical protein